MVHRAGSHFVACSSSGAKSWWFWGYNRVFTTVKSIKESHSQLNEFIWLHKLKLIHDLVKWTHLE